MACSTCDTFPAPTSKFDELGVDEKRHATLYRCSDCGRLIETIAEERSPRHPGLADSLTNYFDSTFWPVSVPSLFCKSCGESIDLKAAIHSSPYSWPHLSTFWHECSTCGTGNHIQFKKGGVSIIEIAGAPGPTWVALSTSRVADADVREDPEFLQVWLGDAHRAIPSRK